MKIRNILLILFSLFLFSCQSETQKSIDNLITEFKIPASKKQVLFIIPANGCGSCIAKGVVFAKSNIENKDIIFIVSNIGQKQINLMFTELERQNPNFISDYEGVALQYNLVATAAVVYFMENTKIKEQIILTSQNSEQIFDKIKKFVE